MIPLTDADKRTLTAPRVVIDFGCDVLDDNDAVIDTLGPTWVTDDAGQRIVEHASDLLGGTVTHDSTVEVHRDCELIMTRGLDWGDVWLRPWQSVTAYGHTVVGHLGVFRATAPELPMGTEPLTWRVQGADRLSLLQDIIGDTVVSEKGARVGDELRAAIAAAQVPGAILCSGDIGSMTLGRPMAWLLDSGQPTTHLQRINDLAAAAGIQPVYMDSDGRFRLSPNQPAATRPADWLFDVNDPRGILRVDRSSSSDMWTTTNWWRFLVQDRTSRPLEGSTQYTVDRSNGARKVRKIVEASAADYASLVAVGDQQVETDTSRAQTVDITVTGFPVLEHRDVLDYIDPQLRGGSRQHTVCRGFTLDLASGANKITVEIPDV